MGYIMFKILINSELSRNMMTNMTICAGTYINFNLLVQGNSLEYVVIFFCTHLFSQQPEDALSYVTLLFPAVDSAKFTVMTLAFQDTYYS